MSRTVLITGATGTVSTALMRALEGAGVNLRALVREESAADGPRERGAEVAEVARDHAAAFAPAGDR